MKIAVITGASSGIGREFARQISKCYRKLDQIWLVARSTSKLEKVKEELERESQITVKIYDGDLLRDYIYYRLEKDLAKERPDIRMLVNAAGFGKTGTVAQTNEQTLTDMVELNCKALTRVTAKCLPYLSKGSRIVNAASAAAFAPQPKFAVYAATKSYVLSFSRALGMEVKGRGVIVTAICPGPVDTPFFKVSGGLNNKAKEAVMAKPEAVVKKALRDTRKGRDISIYGAAMKGVKTAVKLLPDTLVVRIMERMSR